MLETIVNKMAGDIVDALVTRKSGRPEKVELISQYIFNVLTTGALRKNALTANFDVAEIPDEKIREILTSTNVGQGRHRIKCAIQEIAHTAAD